MKKSPLSWLQNVEAIFLEKGQTIPDTLVAEKRQPKLIAGFPVEAIHQEAVSNPLKEKWNTLKVERDTFETALKANGIEPIAILPTKLWKKICTECKLLRLEHFDEKGKVKGDAEKLTDLLANLGASVLMFIVLGIFSFLPFVNVSAVGIATYFTSATAIVLAVFVLKQDFYKKFVLSSDNHFLYYCGLAMALELISLGLTRSYGIDLPFFCFLGPLFLFVICGMAWAFFDERKDGHSNRTHKLLLSILPMQTLVKALWPKGNDEISGTSFSLTPIMPVAPKEFNDKLLVLASAGIALKACVAIEPKALSVSRRELAGGMPEALKKIWEERDPVVYCKSQNENLVAVVAQFGRLSREKKAIKFATELKPEELF